MATDSKRYTVPTDEDWEPGSDNQVLKNYLGIKSREDIEAIEEQELERTELELLDIFNKDHQFTVADICNMHELWLGDIYPSADKFRTVMMSKAGFPFAAPSRIEPLMQEFEEKYLAKYTPCHYSEIDALAHALEVVHSELVIIHPFREGNGRTARLLADLMAMQAKKAPLNYSSIQTQNLPEFENYIQSIHAGFEGNYKTIEGIFKKLLEEST
ncbi:MAG: Fic family protein [Proteobacteria bacterium]|nr:Fic family protein [Pseudomonadota bacterium]